VPGNQPWFGRHRGGDPAGTGACWIERVGWSTSRCMVTGSLYLDPSPPTKDWRRRPSGNGRIAISPSLARSPLVIGMPKPMACCHGWPARPIGGRNFFTRSRSTGWSSFGHPEWAIFRLGKTNPLNSTSGLHALIAAYFAASGRSSASRPLTWSAPRSPTSCEAWSQRSFTMATPCRRSTESAAATTGGRRWVTSRRWPRGETNPRL